MATSDAVAEGPRPMKGDDPMPLTWTIKEFSKLDMRKNHSEAFTVGDCKWRVFVFPKRHTEGYLTMSLDLVDSETLPKGWSINAQFSLAVVNQIHGKYTIRKDSRHMFRAGRGISGFASFMPLSELYNPGSGYIVNDTCIIEAKVVVRSLSDYRSHDPKKETGCSVSDSKKETGCSISDSQKETARSVSDYSSYDSKTETGYVGLKNQGATCYMNSLLQTLYHLPYFRKAVYHMPTTKNDDPSSSIPLALQILFYKLQNSNTSVATTVLTKSFGWNTHDSFIQHDVQEFNRLLCEKLERKMQRTVVEGTVQQLFEGHLMNYMECINIVYESTRMESYYDIQLDVKGCKDIYASFDKYVDVVSLKGDNKYMADQYGLQDARKRALFIDFPPVLQLHLKRFEFDRDLIRDNKINDRYEFPLQLDLDRDDRKYMSPDADRSVRNLYTLHSVLVHSGGVGGGHYYAYIRPTLSEQWFKFNDTIVTKVEMKGALEEQYGGEQYSGKEELPHRNRWLFNFSLKSTKCSNAYMLVYIRESDKERILCDVDEKDVAEHLRIRLKKVKGQKDQPRKEKAEAHLYTTVKVARDNDLVEQIGRDIFFDLVNHEKVHCFHIQKQMIFSVFKEEIAKKFDVPVHLQRFWLWAKRQNLTYRPNRPLTPREEAETVGRLREISNLQNNAELKLFLEVELGVDMKPVSLPERAKDDILLFFKLYDPCKVELRYVGRLFVKGSEEPTEILAKLKEMAGFSADEDIDLFEEVKFHPNVLCKLIDKKFSFSRSQLEDGDIICYQKSQGQNIEKYQYADVPSFLDYVLNRQTVLFRSLEKLKGDEFCLQLARKNNYDEVVRSGASHIGLADPSKIRLTSHNCYTQLPKTQPIGYQSVDCLTEMLVHNNEFSNILYYEVLDMPLPEFQGLKTLKVTYHHATKDKADIHNIRLPMQSTVGDILGELKTKVELSHPDAELRLLDIFHHKICKIYPLNERVENVSDQHMTLRAEEIPEEEKTLSPNDQLIRVTHLVGDTAQTEMEVKKGLEPFLLVIHEGETLTEVKARTKQKLQVPEEDFSKWKFAIMLSFSPPEYLEDSTVISTYFQKRDDYGPQEPHLGLEHTDTLPVRLDMHLTRLLRCATSEVSGDPAAFCNWRWLEIFTRLCKKYLACSYCQQLHRYLFFICLYWSSHSVISYYTKR